MKKVLGELKKPEEKPKKEQEEAESEKGRTEKGRRRQREKKQGLLSSWQERAAPPGNATGDAAALRGGKSDDE